MINLDSGEELTMRVRRHWWALFSEAVSLLVLAALPTIVFAAMAAGGAFSLSAKLFPLFLFASAAWWLFVWIMFFIMWTNYYFDLWLVTNKRLIHIEQRTLFSREMSTFRLDKLQDISVEMRGLIAHLFHFGDIHAQTAGEAREFKIRHIHNPHKIKDEIWQAHDALMQTHQVTALPPQPPQSG